MGAGNFKRYDPDARTFSNTRGHQSTVDGAPSQVVNGIELVRRAQATGAIGEYGFVCTADTGEMVYFGDVPPYMHLTYVVVPKDRAAYYHYGLDGMLHPDWREHIKLWHRIDATQ